MLANLVEHTRTIRLFPRPVVSLQSKSFLQSRYKISTFIEEFCRTQVRVDIAYACYLKRFLIVSINDVSGDRGEQDTARGRTPWGHPL